MANTLQCTGCTANCPAGQFLSGECSTFSNPKCTACRAPCGLAEIEVKACNASSDRKCLPNPGCYQDCPSGERSSFLCCILNLLLTLRCAIA